MFTLLDRFSGVCTTLSSSMCVARREVQPESIPTEIARKPRAPSAVHRRCRFGCDPAYKITSGFSSLLAEMLLFSVVSVHGLRFAGWASGCSLCRPSIALLVVALGSYCARFARSPSNRNWFEAKNEHESGNFKWNTHIAGARPGRFIDFGLVDRRQCAANLVDNVVVKVGRLLALRAVLAAHFRVVVHFDRPLNYAQRNERHDEQHRRNEKREHEFAIRFREVEACEHHQRVVLKIHIRHYRMHDCSFARAYLVVKARVSRLGRVVVPVTAVRLDEAQALAAQRIHASLQIDVQAARIVNS